MMKNILCQEENGDRSHSPHFYPSLIVKGNWDKKFWSYKEMLLVIVSMFLYGRYLSGMLWGCLIGNKFHTWRLCLRNSPTKYPIPSESPQPVRVRIMAFKIRIHKTQSVMTVADALYNFDCLNFFKWKRESALTENLMFVHYSSIYVIEVYM